MSDTIGPQTEFSRLLHKTKYRSPEEDFDDYCIRWARATTDNDKDFRRALKYTRSQLLLPAGRQQHSMGQPWQTTAYNCFVGAQIPDSYEGILEALKLGGMTLRTGGGMGWDFSTLRPAGEPINGLGHGSFSSGPVSFMNIWDANCSTILTAGHRRGAMMAVLRVDHPDIMKFISAKRATGKLKNFNISVAVTDAFMEALANDGLYELRFNGRSHGWLHAVDVWAKIMESNWDWAEPGMLYIDRINQRNPLFYCESIYATNPCAEQPLPPNGACLLGSINIVKIVANGSVQWDLLADVVDTAVRCFDNVPERTNFPLEAQRREAQNKRRMGLGVTGMANALEIMGFRYGEKPYIKVQNGILKAIKIQAYRTSIELAKEKGAFPLYDARYHDGWFFKNCLDEELQHGIRSHGLRNGLLLSIAPTGTISMCADNVSSGIEPPYAIHGSATLQMPDGPRTFDTTDYAYAFHKVRGLTANDIPAETHVDVMCAAQKHIDSSISKTCNVTGQISGSGPGTSFKDFCGLYLRAWEGGAKGCTTFNRNGKLLGVRQDREAEGAACSIDPETGARSCE